MDSIIKLMRGLNMGYLLPLSDAYKAARRLGRDRGLSLYATSQKETRRFDSDDQRTVLHSDPIAMEKVESSLIAVANLGVRGMASLQGYPTPD